MSFSNIQSPRVIALAAAIAAVSTPAFADSARIQELEQRLLILERNLELKEEAQIAKEKAAPIVNAGAGGFSITNAKKDYELKFSAVGQFDSRVFLDGARANGAKLDDGFVTRRLRPTIQGKLGDLAEFRFTPEFGGGGVGSSASIVDAYVDLKFHKAALLRVGKQKSAVSIDRLRSGAALPFIERGLANELAPNRDLGVSLNGQLAKNTITYTAGIFNGVADGRDVTGRDDSGKEAQARIFLEPFKNNGDSVLQGLGFRVAGTYGTKKTSSGNTALAGLPQYRSSGQENFFTYAAGAVADGKHKRVLPQLSYYIDSFGVVAEYAISDQEVTRAAVTESVKNKAYDITATYVLTGEKASYRGVQPSQPFTLNGDGWGAFEVAVRVGELKIDDIAFASNLADINAAAKKANNYGIGLNWYLNRNVKLSTDYNEKKFEGGAAGGRDRETERALFTRVQFTY